MRFFVHSVTVACVGITALVLPAIPGTATSASCVRASGKHGHSCSLATSSTQADSTIPPPPTGPSAPPAPLSESGAYVTRIPITIPDYHSLQPPLALTYDSSAGNDAVGVGWNLSGLSSIQEASPAHGAPSFSATDVFYLDGTPLIPCDNANPAPPKDGSCATTPQGMRGYVTAFDDHRRIAYDNDGGWHVWTKNGVRYDYNYPQELGRALPAIWRLSKVTDAVGRTVSYTYIQLKGPNALNSSDTANTYISNIAYDNDLVAIHFYWEPRPDPLTRAAPGIPNPDSALVAMGGEDTMSYRLHTVAVSVGSHPNSAYALCYANDTTATSDTCSGPPKTSLQRCQSSRMPHASVPLACSRIRLRALKYSLQARSAGPSMLQSVQRYGTDITIDQAGNITGPAHEPPTILNYSGGGFNVWTKAAPQSVFPPPDSGALPVPGFPGVPVPVSETDAHAAWTAADVNGDGSSDFVYVSQPDNPLTPQSRLTIQTVLARHGGDPSPSPISSSVPYTGPTTFSNGDSPLLLSVFPADLLGTGRADLILSFVYGLRAGPGNTAYYSHYFLLPLYSSSDVPGEYIPGPPLGATAQDLSGTRLSIWDSDPNTGLNQSPVTVQPNCQATDVNGDGREDIVCLDEDIASESQGQPTLYRLVTFISVPSYSYGPTSAFGFEEVDQDLALNRYQYPPDFVVGDVSGSQQPSVVLLDEGSNPAYWDIVTITSVGSGTLQVHRQPTPYWPVYRGANPELLMGDITGDGRADLVAITTNSPTIVNTAVTQPDGSYDFHSETVPSDLSKIHHTITVGDADGDGRADLLVATELAPNTGTNCSVVNYGTTMTTRVLSNGDGTFAFPPNWSDCLWSHHEYLTWDESISAPVSQVTAADTTGNGLADFLLVSPLPDPKTSLPVGKYLLDDPSVQQGQDQRQLVSAHLRSWNETDLVYLQDTGTGTVIHSYLRNPNGQYTHVSQPFDRPGGRPVRSAWQALDLVGNGRTDLVYIGHLIDMQGNSQSQHLYIDTFLANGDGTWDESTQIIEDPSDATATSAAVSSLASRWRVLDLGPSPGQSSGGDRYGLTYLWYPASGGTRLLTLIYNPASGWQLSDSDPTAALYGDNTANWLVADVNGDGRDDVIQIEVDATTVYILTWLSDGFGHWTSSKGRWQTTIASDWQGVSPTNLAAWRVLDANGDGESDLVYLQPTSRGVTVWTLLSSGFGGWLLQPTPISAGTASTADDWKDLNNWQPADLEKNGQIGLLHMTRTANGVRPDAIQPGSDGYHWTSSVGSEISLSPGTARGGFPWLPADINGQGLSDVEYVDLRPDGVKIQPLASAVQRVLLTRLSEPLGGSVGMHYQSSDYWPVDAGNSGCYLLPGMAVSTLSQLTVSDGRGDTSTLQFAYKCPQWWAAQRQFMGWRDNAVTRLPSISQAGATSIVTYRIAPFGLRVLDNVTVTGQTSVAPDTLPTPSSPVYGSTQYSYEANLADQFHSDPSDVVESMCESSTSPCAEEDLHYHYDGYGNLTELDEAESDAFGTYPPQIQRSTILSYAPPSPSKYLVGLVSDEVVTPHWYPVHAGPTLSETRTCYDVSNSDCTNVPTQGQVTSISRYDDIDHSWSTVHYSYNDHGDVSEITDPNGHHTMVNYDPSNEVLPTYTASTELPSISQRESWYPVTWLPKGVTDANGQITSMGYDPMGHLTSVAYPGSGTETFDYGSLATRDPGARGPIIATIPDGSPPGEWVKEYIDGLGRPYEFQRNAGNGAVAEQLLTYGDAISSNAYKVSDWFDPATETPNWTTFAYDARGRTISQTDPNGNSISWQYSTYAFLNKPTGVLVTTASEGATTETTWTDAWGNHLASFSAHNGVRISTTYAYDSVDRLVKVTDPQGNVQTFAYDSLGQLRQENDPDRGTTSYAYDLAGNLLRTIDARKIETDYTYDPVDRLITRTHPGKSAEKVTLIWDQGGANGIGRLTRVKDASGLGCQGNVADSFRYNSMGLVTQWSKCILGKSDTFTTSYAPVGAGRLASSASTHGVPVTYQYDQAGRVVGVLPFAFALTCNPNNRQSGPGYNAADELTGVSYGSGSGSGGVCATGQPQQDLGYDPTTRELSNWQLRASSTTLPWFGQSLGYELTGAVSSIAAISGAGSFLAPHEQAAGSAVATPSPLAGKLGVKETLSHDDLGRLIAGSGPQTVTFAYNNSGAITSSSFLGTYTYPQQGPNGCGTGSPCPAPDGVRQAGAHTYSYDATGNMVTRDGLRLIWNDDGNLSWIQHRDGSWTHNVFDAAGQLVYVDDKSRGPGTRDNPGAATYIFSDLADYSATAGWRQYARLAGILVGIHDRAGNHAVVTGYDGSVELVLDRNHRVEGIRRYTLYGAPVGASHDAASAVGYLGERYDTTTGLLHTDSRFYDPELGQFLSPDQRLDPPPLPGTGTPYSYGYDDPVTYQDPSGNDPGDPSSSVDPGTADVGISIGTDLSADSSCAGCETLSVTQFEDQLAAGPLAVETAHAPLAPYDLSTAGSQPNGSVQPGTQTPSWARTGFALGVAVPYLSLDPTRLPQAAAIFAGVVGVAWGAIQIVGGSAGNAFGGALDATGPGALAGVPLNVASTAVIVHGAASVTVGIGAIYLAMAASGGKANSGRGSTGTPATRSRIRANYGNGMAWEEQLAEEARQAGFRVQRNVPFFTPYGWRFIDLVISDESGNVWLVEAKASQTAPYPLIQQTKDLWIYEATGLLMELVRQ